MKFVSLDNWESLKVPEDVKGKRIAILLIHGIGQQEPLETLDQFARGLYDELEAERPNTHELWHRQVARTAGSNESWLENYVAIESHSSPSIDIYEYYWAHQMTGQASLADCWEWLIETSRYARQYYKNRRVEDAIRAHQTSSMLNRQQPLKLMFNREGSFRRNGYLRLFVGAVGWFRFVPMEFLIGLLGATRIGKLLLALMRRAQRLILDYVGDVVVYTSIDRKSKHYHIRKEILENARQEIEGLVRNGEYGSVLVAGHSLGSVIGYDALNRLHTKPIPPEDVEVREAALKRIRGFITFGSPLDKIGFFFRQHVARDAYIRQQLLDHIHSFLRPARSEIEPVVQTETCNHLRDVRWLNFYAENDPVSGALNLYDVSENIPLTLEGRLGRAHVAYWGSDEMYRRILREFTTTPESRPRQAVQHSA